MNTEKFREIYRDRIRNHNLNYQVMPIKGRLSGQEYDILGIDIQTLQDGSTEAVIVLMGDD